LFFIIVVTVIIVIAHMYAEFHVLDSTVVSPRVDLGAL